ncbi:MAG TPA: hypothetical protein VHJ20_08190 [Polyangia bacterium]|nr:hypothetical protein [Polyangia bacterium]
MGAALWSTPAFADPPAGAPPAAPPDAPATPPPPMPAAPPPPPPAAPPPTNTDAMAATRPDVLPPIDVGAWVRAGSLIQKSDWHMDNAYVELHAGGKIHKNVGVTVNLASNYTNFSTANVQVEDAIISFDPVDEFHVWAGHLLVPVDRANASGPFFMIPWNYPGFLTNGLTTVVTAPLEGPLGRNNGAVVWGDIMKGKLTYLAGVFDNGSVATSPLYSGRLRLCLWDPEGGFWGNGSFFGDKDILSIGVGAQYQKHGVSATQNWTDINVDALIEKKLGGGAFVTGEAAYYHFSNVMDNGYVLAAYASPTLGGIGNLQPSVRYQWAKPKGGGSTVWDIGPQLSFLVKGPALRVNATYTHTDLGSGAPKGDAFQLGAQAIFF